ncbi:hypothetical protein FXF51_01515 [Nonomuraea sp. PA05]|uniref:DUF6197 family protein n=1 Tax=Nonomuraea sp. PA05 TaxID=2604466 RepID=UPI0011D4BF5A|nr:hypothetical protein [Nonomuraea sp. PA05]TYB71139.1 hypothetical protein FXF51_01515 [Nonomuraea sp. PA05]
MTDLLTDAPELTPADLIRDAIELMRTTWRVRGDFVIGRLTTSYGFCPMGAISAIAGDVFVSGRPTVRVPLVRHTAAWLVSFHRLPRCREEREKNRSIPRLAYMRVAEWTDTFTEAQDDDLYAALEAAATAWQPSTTKVGATANRKRKS